MYHLPLRSLFTELTMSEMEVASTQTQEVSTEHGG